LQIDAAFTSAMKDLETENAPLRKAVSALTPDKLILQDAARGTAVREWIAAVDGLHGARQPMGERLHRELQRPPARRAAGGGDFPFAEAGQIVIESWRRHYNPVRPHEPPGYRPPAPEVFVPAFAAWPSARLGSAPTATLPPVSRPEPNQHWSRTTRRGPIKSGPGGAEGIQGLLHEPAVADNDGLPGHHVAAGRGEEQNRVCDIVGGRELTVDGLF